jgi:prophage regulatory protein
MATPELQSNDPLQVLRLPQVCKVTGLCRSMIYQLEAERRFPCRIKLGLRAVGWIEGEVQEWLAARIERSRGTASD